MTATTNIVPANKMKAYWARKIKNRKQRKMGILDTGATSGAAPEEDKECFVDTGEASAKTFMFPDKRTNKANMDAMMEKMNSLVATNKENTRQNGNGNENSDNTGKIRKSQSRRRCYAQTGSVSCTTSPIAAMNWKKIKQKGTQGGSQSLRRQRPFDRDRGQQ